MALLQVGHSELGERRAAQMVPRTYGDDKQKQSGQDDHGARDFQDRHVG